MLLVERPGAYDVIVTENLFGDVLSDLAASVSGGIGLAPSASLADGGPGIFEPIHGTAPDIAGLGKANPAGAILSVALLLDELGQPARRARDRGRRHGSARRRRPYARPGRHRDHRRGRPPRSQKHSPPHRPSPAEPTGRARMSTAEKRPASAEAPPPNPYEGQRLTGAEAVIRSLETCGVEICFGIPGGAILPIYDALASTGTTIKHVLVRHEQGAGHMAQGYARATGKVGVAMATSGPGRDEPRHAGRRRVPRLDAARDRHRPGAVAPDRHRRVPGGRHDRHLHADRQALLPRHEGRGHPARVHGGVPPGLDRAPGPRADRHPEGRREHVVHVPLAAAARPAGLPPDAARATRCRSRRRRSRSRAPRSRCSTSAAASSTPAPRPSCRRSPRRRASRS